MYILLNKNKYITVRNSIYCKGSGTDSVDNWRSHRIHIFESRRQKPSSNINFLWEILTWVQ